MLVGMLVVDAANVIGSRPDGWWRDRPAAAGRFVGRVRGATADGRLDAPVTVVVEGRARAGAEVGDADGVAVVHAIGSGDDEIVVVAAAAVTSSPPDGDGVVVVTADRALADRVRAVGADVVGPRWLLDRLDP